MHDGERAIAHALVCASCVACEATRAPAAPCTRSREDGRYAFEDLAPAGYFVSASAAGFAPASAAGGAPVILEPGQSLADMDIALVRGGARVRGSVVDATGGPLGHARTWLPTKPATFCVRVASANVQLDAPNTATNSSTSNTSPLAASTSVGFLPE